MKEAGEEDSSPCVGLMAVNGRGRVENCEDTDAGNYEDMIYYLGAGKSGSSLFSPLLLLVLASDLFLSFSLLRGPEDHGTPSLIRKSLKVMNRVGNTRMPSLLAQLRMRGSLVTNWSSFCIPPPDAGKSSPLQVSLLCFTLASDLFLSAWLPAGPPRSLLQGIGSTLRVVPSGHFQVQQGQDRTLLRWCSQLSGKNQRSTPGRAHCLIFVILFLFLF